MRAAVSAERPEHDSRSRHAGRSDHNGLHGIAAVPLANGNADTRSENGGEYTDLDNAPGGGRRWYAALDEPVDQVTSDDCQQPPDQKRRVRRPAKQLNAGEQVIEPIEHRRIPAERIDDHRQQCDRIGAYLPIPRQPTD